MATTGGPNIERDGLVFGYDTNYGVADNVTGTRFYPGEPVANMLNYGDNFNSWTKARNSGSNPTVDVKVKEGPFKNTLADRLSLPSDGSYPRIYQNFTPASTATHTFSVWLKGETSGQGCFVGAFRNSPWSLPSSTNFSITNEWVNYSFNINPQDTSSMQLYIGSHNSHGGKSFLIYGAQLETGSTKSVFIDGTRSSTQSLIDLTRTIDIDVANVSFDSTGQPEFDGTDDRITLPAGSYETIGTSDFTVETVCKNTKTSSYNHFFSVKDQYHFAFKASNTSTGILYVYRTSALSTASAIAAYIPSRSDYYHLLCKREGDNLEIFVNGVSKGTKSGWNNISIDNNAHPSYIGWGNGSEYTGGSIPVTKIYNRALSAEEVQQNFNAYKNRFNI